ncbi:MAG: hypothetical protein ACI9QD_001157 [Thermoproteota archaeon]|jgi:hypothetical protein
MRKKKHSIILAIIGFFYLVNFKFEVAGILISFAAFMYHSWYHSLERKYFKMIEEDRVLTGAQIPRSGTLKRYLHMIYAKSEKLSQKYPLLQESYQSLMTSMWIKLSSTTSPVEWIETIKRTYSEWPDPSQEIKASNGKLRDHIEESINRVKNDILILRGAVQKATT